VLHLPTTLRGRVADLGAGSGLRSLAVRERCPAVTALELFEAEARAVHALVTEPNFSPAFLRLLIKRHGAESVLAVFHLNRQPADLAITVLLRRYKGEHYRPRTPAVSLVD
jgi:hypothetical protein